MQFQMQSHDCCESENCAHVEFVKKKLRDLHNSLIGLAYIGWYLVILYLIIYLNKLSVFSYSNTNLLQLFCEKLQNLKPKSERVSFCVNSWKSPVPINSLHEPGLWLSWRIPRLMIIMMVILMILWLYYGVKWYVPTQYNQPNKKK